MSRILVVDDKEMMRDSVSTALARKGHTVLVAPNGAAALKKIEERLPDVVLTDLQMPEMNGMELLDAVRKLDEQLPVVFMTAFGTVETAVAALKKGAFDYITKPFSGDELVVTIDRAARQRQLLQENQILKAEAAPAGPVSGTHDAEMIGDGPVMCDLRGALKRIADSHGTVLVSGESGSGKEIAARWVHAHSPRAAAPFLAINCAALSTSLLESELFGHEKGAFTGADRLRKGRFELADGGTLLLDEISEIAPEIQAKLLRVLQEHAFERVGSSTTRRVDVRVIATTNRHLPEEVAKGTFREDLYFRLNVLPVAMPALREHATDVGELARHFLERVARREGKPVKVLDHEAIELMETYRWPGNVRELQNICERAAVLAETEVIDAEMIAPWLGQSLRRPAPPEDAMELGAAFALTEPKPGAIGQPVVCDGTLRLEDVERETILATLRHNGGHRQRSAHALGIGVRTLGLKLKKWKEQEIVEPTL